MKLYSLKSIFNFGMHKGKTLKQVLEFTGIKNYPNAELEKKFEENEKYPEKVKLTVEEELEYHLRNSPFPSEPSGPKYIKWCINEIEGFYIDSETISVMEELNNKFKISEKENKILEKKLGEWKSKNDADNNNESEGLLEDYNDINYCGSCMESPCQCNDSEKTSKTYE